MPKQYRRYRRYYLFTLVTYDMPILHIVKWRFGVEIRYIVVLSCSKVLCVNYIFHDLKSHWIGVIITFIIMCSRKFYRNICIYAAQSSLDGDTRRPSIRLSERTYNFAYKDKIKNRKVPFWMFSFTDSRKPMVCGRNFVVFSILH